MRTMVEPWEAVARMSWMAAKRDLLAVLGERRREEREEMRVGTWWWEGWDGERMMRRVLRVERIERSWWRGEEDAGLFGRVRGGDWKISSAFVRAPVP